MQLILNNQVRGKQLFFELVPAIGITGSVETTLVPTVYFSKEGTALADPREIGKLIHCGYQKAWDASVQRLVNRHNREMSVALEIAIAIHTDNMQIGRVVCGRYKVKRSGFELLPAPWARLKGNGRGLLIVVLKCNRLSASRFPVVVPLLSHAVRCGR